MTYRLLFPIGPLLQKSPISMAWCLPAVMFLLANYLTIVISQLFIVLTMSFPDSSKCVNISQWQTVRKLHCLTAAVVSQYRHILWQLPFPKEANCLAAVIPNIGPIVIELIFSTPA